VLRDLFSDWCVGRLDQRRFALLYIIVLVALIVLSFLVFAIALTAVAVFNADGSMRGGVWLGLALIGGVLVMLAALFNIVVKRGRDIGIPGFITGICFLVMFAIGGVPVFATILLALVPTGSFASSRLNS